MCKLEYALFKQLDLVWSARRVGDEFREGDCEIVPEPVCERQLLTEMDLCDRLFLILRSDLCPQRLELGGSSGFLVLEVGEGRGRGGSGWCVDFHIGVEWVGSGVEKL